MSDDAFARLAAANGQQLQSRPPPDYAFTEITTFHISPESVIENTESKEGELWANTVRIYIEDPGTKLLWWGRLLEDPGRVKLVVDWIDGEQHRHFQQSPHFKELRGSWGEVVKTSFYVFPDWPNDRRNAFTKSSWGNIVSTILIFHFPSSLDPLEKEEWDIAWEQFSYVALKSDGGGVSSKTCAGWSLDHSSFCGVVRYMDVTSMKHFLSREVLGLGKLKELAGEGMDVEFASMYCLEDGWLGKVTETRKDNPEVRKMFEDVREWHRKLENEKKNAGTGDNTGLRY